MYINSNNFELPPSLTADRQPLKVEAKALPAGHPAEPDVFARHADIPGHVQDKLTESRIVMVGAGGLNSWAALALIRSGASQLTIIDPDVVDRSNLARQLYFAEDLGEFKAHRLPRNLASHALIDTVITGIPLPFEEACNKYATPADVLVVGVDNNACRIFASKLAKDQGIPAVFTMLSLDGMRCHVFLQDAGQEAPCLLCAIPMMNPQESVPCAAAISTSCMLASSFTTFFVHRALMGWSNPNMAFNWREDDLLGIGESKTGRVEKDSACPACSGWQ